MEMMKKIDELETCESTCHECPSNYEVKNYKEDIGVKNEELMMKKWNNE